MNINTDDGLKQINDIAETVEEYHHLIRLSSPSDEQITRIDEILEQAIDNNQLAECLNKIDEELAQELRLIARNNDSSDIEVKSDEKLAITTIFRNSVNDNYDDNQESDNWEIRDKTLSANKRLTIQHGQKVKGNSKLIPFPSLQILQSETQQTSPINCDTSSGQIRHAITLIKKYLNNTKPFYWVIGGLCLIWNLSIIDTNLSRLKELAKNENHHTQSIQSLTLPENANNQGMRLMNANISSNVTQLSICDSNSDTLSKEMQEYYRLYSQLEHQVERQELTPLKIKEQVQYLQQIAERKQRKWEIEQENAEMRKYQAELQKNYDDAQKLKNKAINSLAISRKWLCLSRHALALTR